MAGNVDEWVSSLYMPYPYDANDGREDMSSFNIRVLRGGAWNYNDGGTRSAFRSNYTPSGSLDFVGFRCARSLP
jgi:formylglycine-generating enzyme required for sulfatase activity